MDQREKAKRLKTMLEQIAPGDSLKTVHVPEIHAAAGGLDGLAHRAAPPPVATETLNSGIDKLARGQLEIGRAHV